MPKKLKIIIPIVIFVVLIVICLVFIHPNKSKKVKSNNNELIGLWDIDGNTKYEFSEDGKGKLIVPLAEYEFTYIITDDTLSIDFENENSTDMKYTYKVSDNELEIINTDDSSLHFKLKKIED